MSTPIPLLCSMAAAVSSANSDTGRIAAIRRQTKWCHFKSTTLTIFNTSHYGKLSPALSRRLWSEWC